jgi:hypothetical protein
MTCTGFQPSVASIADIANAHIEGKMQLTNATATTCSHPCPQAIIIIIIILLQ